MVLFLSQKDMVIYIYRKGTGDLVCSLSVALSFLSNSLIESEPSLIEVLGDIAQP
jgi:hypothetical protein